MPLALLIYVFFFWLRHMGLLPNPRLVVCKTMFFTCFFIRSSLLLILALEKLINCCCTSTDVFKYEQLLTR